MHGEKALVKTAFQLNQGLINENSKVWQVRLRSAQELGKGAVPIAKGGDCAPKGTQHESHHTSLLKIPAAIAESGGFSSCPFPFLVAGLWKAMCLENYPSLYSPASLPIILMLDYMYTCNQMMYAIAVCYLDRWDMMG